MKFDSGVDGHPSILNTPRPIFYVEDHSHGMHRVEVRCSSARAHLGHVFDDGPAAYGGERYCINSASMVFEEKDGE